VTVASPDCFLDAAAANEADPINCPVTGGTCTSLSNLVKISYTHSHKYFTAVGSCPWDKPYAYDQGAQCCDGAYDATGNAITTASPDCFLDIAGTIEAEDPVTCPTVGGICKSLSKV